MRGTKRLAVSESTADTNNSFNKKSMVGPQFPQFDFKRAEQKSMGPTSLDMGRAESSRQHVRALNNQFASWIQSQLQNHPDELWEDGVHDYLTHASNILEKFSDVVNWLKLNSTKSDNLLEHGSFSTQKKPATENKESTNLPFQEKTLNAPPSGTTPMFATSAFAPSWSTGPLFNNQSSFSLDRTGRMNFMHRATTAPILSYYDYIVVGGGTAGCALAATLSQRSTVLLLERGGSPFRNPNLTHLSKFGAALSDLSPKSPSQRFVSEDGVINARARVLGGGSSLNAGFYSRAGSDYIAKAGWDAKLVSKSYRWVERLVAFYPPVRQWQSAVRNSLLEIGIRPYNGYTLDHLYGTKVGGTIFDAYGRRHSSADLLHYANPRRLTVYLHASVYRILFTTKGKQRPRANGVIFTDANGLDHWAYLRRGPNNEVIVCSGSLGSPQLLLLSGIGPKKHLKNHNIPLVLDQPLVGQGMSDNPMNAVFVPSPRPVEMSLVEVVGITRSGSYIEGASGKNFGMFSPKIGQLSTLPPKQRRRKALNRAIAAMRFLPRTAFVGGFILEKIIGPLSRGHLELRSMNPNDNPSVTFNYFKDRRDLEKCVEGIKIIEKVIQSRSFSRFRYHYLPFSTLLNMTANSPVNLLPKHANASRSLKQFCRDTVMTIWHYHGGCQVEKVVDRDYKVMGVDALRVIDGSTFDISPGTNPQATVMMLGRYMGVKMLRDRLAKKGTDS